MATQKTYRHAKTGIVRDYSPTVARRFPDLIEVEPGTKPLAYTPIPQPEIDEVLEKRSRKPRAADEQVDQTTTQTDGED